MTYLFLDSGTGMYHRASLGTRTLIEPGGLHRTAANRGVVHEEVPAATGRTTHRPQIVVNLPADRPPAASLARSLVPQDVPVLQRAFFMPINGSAALDGVGFGLDDLGAAHLPVASTKPTHRPVATARVASTKVC